MFFFSFFYSLFFFFFIIFFYYLIFHNFIFFPFFFLFFFFLRKAKLEVDVSPKWTTYRLLNIIVMVMTLSAGLVKMFYVVMDLYMGEIKFSTNFVDN